MCVECLHFELKRITLSVCRVLAGRRTLFWRYHTCLKNKLVNFIYHNQVYEAFDVLTPPTFSSICATFPLTLFVPVTPQIHSDFEELSFQCHSSNTFWYVAAPLSRTHLPPSFPG